jgi:hypothetical protein
VPETRELVGWMEAAFKRYAERRAHVVGVCEPGETPEQSRDRLLLYGDEFSRILRGTADYHIMPEEILDNFYDLKKRSCPAQDVVEFMLACTNWFGGDLSKVDEAFGIPEAVNTVRSNCRKMSEDISALNLPMLLCRPHDFLREEFPNRRERRKARRLIDSLPDALLHMDKLLDRYLSAPAPVPMAVLRSGTEAYFWALLAFFEHDDGTLGELLGAIRAIRFAVSPDATYVRNIAPIPIQSGEAKGAEKDLLSSGAVQKRLDRLFEQNPSFKTEVMSDVRQYVTDEYAERRGSGATLLSLLPQLEKNRIEKRLPTQAANSPRNRKSVAKPVH